MSESEWQEIKEHLEGADPIKVSAHRVSAQSPFNLPRSLRAIVSPSDQSIKIEFRYIEDEAAKPRLLGEDVTAWIGKTSKRIRGIQIRRRPLSASGSQNLDSAIDQLISTLSPGETQAEGNYRIVGRVAKEKLHEIEA